MILEALLAGSSIPSGFNHARLVFRGKGQSSCLDLDLQIGVVRLVNREL